MVSINKLSELEIEEVSLVDVPANNKMVIYKSAKSTGDDMKKLTKNNMPPEIPGPEMKKPEDEEEEEETMPEMEQEGMPQKAMPAPDEGAAAATEEARSLLEQARAGAHEAGETEAEEAEEDKIPGREEKAMPEQGIPAEDDGEHEAEGVPAPEIRPEEGEDPMVEEQEEEDAEPMLKEEEEPKFCSKHGHSLENGSCPECAEKCMKSAKKPDKKGGKKPKMTVEKAAVELQKAQAKIAELEKSAMDARHALVQKEFVEKASKEFSHMPGVSSEQLGAVLKNASESMNSEQYTSLITVMKAAEAILSQNVLTQTIGVKADARVNDGSAASRLHAKATEIMNTVQKSGEKVTYEKAYMKAMNENPALYQEYLSGR